jgi:hypothetical protein
MSDAKRTEMLAEMGLRLILAAYKAHPNPALLGPEDAFGMRDVADSYFTDRSYRQQRLTGPESRLVNPLIQSMIFDGVFNGNQAASGTMLVVVTARVREALRKVHDHKPMHDRIEVELHAAFIGDKPALETFVRLAREIGFEP